MIIILQSICPTSSRFYDGCPVPAIADTTDTCLSFVNISGTLLLRPCWKYCHYCNFSGGPLLQTQDTRSRCFRYMYSRNQCGYNPICLTVTIVKEPQSGLLAYYVNIYGKINELPWYEAVSLTFHYTGTDVWCRENELIEHQGLFFECPPITTLLLHYDRHNITTPNQIPPPRKRIDL